MKARLKLCYVKAEMHLDDFILQNLPGDNSISFALRSLCKLNVLKGEKRLCFKRVLQFSSGLLGDEMSVLKNTRGTSAIKSVYSFTEEM